MSVNIQMMVNGAKVAATIDPSMTLVEFIREHLRLTGTHVGCNTSQCGACTVHVNGRAVKSCSLLVAQAQGAEIVTIEGLAAANGDMHPMQAAFKEHHGLQCGFCTPGMVMSACELKSKLSNPTDEQIRANLDGNICRCTGYQNIVSSVKAGLAAMQ